MLNTLTRVLCLTPHAIPAKAYHCFAPFSAPSPSIRTSWPSLS
jgi:hypothetical protein